MKKLILTFSFVSIIFALNFNSNDLCYKSRSYPLKYDIAFEAMKETLINSNMHLKKVSKKDKFISAEGTKYFDGIIYTFTFTIIFKTHLDITNIKTIVSYDTLKDESEIKGVSAFNIPIPIPWSRVFKYKGTTNVDDPQFFDSFYTTFDLNVFNYQMKNMDLNITIKSKKEIKNSEKLDIIQQKIKSKDKIVKKEDKK